MKKVALIGTHGTGKTTLAHELISLSKKEGIDTDFLGELVRQCPFPINENQTRETGEWLIYTQYLKELEMGKKCDLLICDRSILDSYVYNCNKFGRNELLEKFVTEKIKEYEHLVRVPINRNRLKPDKIRSIDPKFQEDIDQEFNSIINHLKIKFTIYENTEQIMKILRKI